MTCTHEVTFEANGVTVDAEYSQMAKSGYLQVWLNGEQIVDLGWVDYQPEFMTNEGLTRFARSEIEEAVGFAASDAADEYPAVIALARQAIGL